jgi:hypothetical protein
VYLLTEYCLFTSWVLYLRVGFLFSVGDEINKLGLVLRVGALLDLVLFSVGVDIWKLFLVLRVGSLLELVLFSFGVDKPQIL